MVSLSFDNDTGLPYDEFKFPLTATFPQTGTIPTELADLQSLQHLRLNNNRFHGELPSGLGYLNELETLYVQKNELSGTIPDSVATLTNLQRARFHDNNFIGAMPEDLCHTDNEQEVKLVELTADCPNEVVCNNCCTLCYQD